MPPRIHIIGRKNSGKTTLIVQLVARLTERGLRVGTIKHTHHEHELDVPGKDSFRHRQAGAAVVGILARNLSAVFWPSGASADKQRRYDEMSRMFADCHLILVEGDSQADAPKIEVWRSAVGAPPLAADDRSIRAVVSDEPAGCRQPVIPRSDLDAIADWIMQELRIV